MFAFWFVLVFGVRVAVWYLFVFGVCVGCLSSLQ